MQYTPKRRGHGWMLRVAQDGQAPADLEVGGIHIDRKIVRAVLTVRVGEAIVYRDTVNLTSDRRRRRLCAQLAEKGVCVDPGALVALDEACRRPPENTSHAGGSGFAGTTAEPLDLVGLRAAFGKWLLITDETLLEVVVGAVLAHRLGFDPVWLLMVAPPGGTKTELLRSFYGNAAFYPLSELTARTFASGLEVPGGRDPSLLGRLKDEILLLKDFTTVLELHSDDRQAILAQLREIYDGRFDKTWGTGRELHWEGRLGFVAGVTPIIDRHQGAMAVLGERFLLYRPEMPDRRRLARRALDGTHHQKEMRAVLASAMRGFLAARGSTVPMAPEAMLDTLAKIADFVTRARSGVYRDRWKRELEYAPEPEAPTRFAKALLALASGIALAHDRAVVTPTDLRVAGRVALDCLPLIRRRVIAGLVDSAIGLGDDLTARTLAGTAQFSTSTIRRALEDLQALGLVTCIKDGKADHWSLHPDWIVIFRELTAGPDEDGTGDGAGSPGDSEADPEPSHWSCASCRSETRAAVNGAWQCLGCRRPCPAGEFDAREPGEEG